MFDKRLILASASSRRRELLQLAGFSFEVRAANIDETRRASELPERYVQRLALEKAHAIATLEPDAVVLGADTTVVLDGGVMNKPADRNEAEWMLLRLSGRTHQVHTGIAAVHGADLTSATHALHVETTNVTFREIEDDELAAYLDSGDAMDKAGAYGIQGYAARWIPRIEGDFFNVVGLPLAAVVALLAKCRDLAPERNMPSSVIVVMVYDPAGQVLEIVYRGGRGTYRYYGVPMAEWLAFRSAPSKGTYLNETFKDKNYRFERVMAGDVPRMPRGSLRWPDPGEEREVSRVSVKAVPS